MMDGGELEEKTGGGEASVSGRERDGGMHRRGDGGGVW